jgi:hypothetical protein
MRFFDNIGSKKTDRTYSKGAQSVLTRWKECARQAGKTEGVKAGLAAKQAGARQVSPPYRQDRWKSRIFGRKKIQTGRRKDRNAS